MESQQQFFSVNHPFEVHITQLPSHHAIPEDHEFLAKMPSSFKLAKQINHLEASVVSHSRHFSEHSTQLADFINLQSKKIDLIMNYILTMDEDAKSREPGTSFGGSHFTYITQSPLPTGALVEAKLFIKESNCSVFAIGRVVSCGPCEQGQLIKIEYVKIDEENQEQLVRTSLHIQTLQLKKRSEVRKASTNDQQDD